MSWPTGYNDQGVYDIKLEVSDGNLNITKRLKLRVMNTNRAPVFTGEASVLATENSQYKTLLKATDQDGDSLDYKLVTGPNGMAIDAKRGLLTWLPSYDDAGLQFVQIDVADHHGAKDSMTFSLQVKNLNRSPIVKNPGVIHTQEDALMRVSLLAADPDGDPLNYRLISGPKGLRLQSTDAVLTWVPSYQQGGKHPVHLVVSDGKKEVALKLWVQVKNSNRAPKINTVSLFNGKEGEKYQ